jgi:hypothetical protein
VAVDHGLPCGDARVVLAGSNVLVHLLPSPVVARVMTGTVVLHDDPKLWLGREVAVTDFLGPTQLAVPPSSMMPPGPFRADGMWMTFASWVEIDGKTEPDDPEQLGLVLRELHRELAGFTGELGTMLDLQADIDRLRLQLPPGPRADAFGKRLAALTDTVFETALPTQALHGDASLGNLLRTPLGLLWNDFEDVLRGPLHWDIAGFVMALENGGADAAFVRKALDSYGWDHEQDLAPFTEAHQLYREIWELYVD